MSQFNPAAPHLSKETSVNLFNKNSPNNVAGKYIDPFNGAITTTTAGFVYSHLIPIRNGATYTFPNYSEYFGASKVTKIIMYDINGNYIGYVTGTFADGKTTATINNASAAFTRVNISTKLSRFPTKEVFMFVEAAEYPSEYVRFYDVLTIPDSFLSEVSKQNLNPLYGKVAIFDGDSICEGISVGAGDSTYGWGWAGRIGTKNNMAWVNYGIGGGTITSGLYLMTENVAGDYVIIAGLPVAFESPTHDGMTRYDKGAARHWCSTNISTIATNHPDADYIILSGGTNDADLIGSGLGGSLSSGYDAVLDTTIFAEAVESMLKTAIEGFPTKKIGFIIEPKMGNPPSPTRKEFFDLAITACIKWGIPYLNLWDECHINPAISSINTLMYTDSQHLTTAGYDSITDRIEAWMKTL